MNSTAFKYNDWNTWENKDFIIYWGVLVAGQELLHHCVEAVGKCILRRIPETGKHLDKFGWFDWFCVYFNRLSVPIMLYHVLQFCWNNSNHIEWQFEKITLFNTIFSPLFMFCLYDIFYVPFHWFLHVRGVYKWIHKHHHRQMAPSRGNLDASNTHPIEFVLGEYLHLLCIFIVPCHVIGVFIFIALGGVMASFNHTRLDINVPGFYSVKYHDRHHYQPRSNYGQYTMFVDMLMGSFVSGKQGVPKKIE